MAKVYAEQIEELNKILPEFKVASAVVHFEERSKSPHMHIVGVPVKEDYKRGMKNKLEITDIYQIITYQNTRQNESCLYKVIQ